MCVEKALEREILETAESCRASQCKLSGFLFLELFPLPPLDMLKYKIPLCVSKKKKRKALFK